MEAEQLDRWWSSLSTVQKERIASKVKSKELHTDVRIYYPFCTQVWQSLKEERKDAIHRHCTDQHGLLLPQWKEGKGMSY